MPLPSLRWLESKAICFCQSLSLRKNVNHLLRNLPYLGGGGGWGGLGLGLTIFFFVRALQKTCSKSQILSTSLRKNVNHLLKNLAYPDGGGGGRGEGGGGLGLGMRVESEMS